MLWLFFEELAGKELGNFFVDFTRALTRVFFLSHLLQRSVFVALGVPQTLDGAVTAQTIDGAKQSILRGPVASFVSIKELGNNGGGFFGANSTHPFENPGQISNILQMMLMMLLPTALTIYVRTNRSEMKQKPVFFSTIRPYVNGSAVGNNIISIICKILLICPGFSKGCVEFAPKNPPPYFQVP